MLDHTPNDMVYIIFQVLDLSYNNIEHVPSWVGGLIKLEIINVCTVGLLAGLVGSFLHLFVF